MTEGNMGGSASVVASSVAQGRGGLHVSVHIEARDVQGRLTQVCDEPDITVTATAQFFQANLLATTPTSLSETLNDVSGTNRASSIGTGQAMSGLVVVGGTTATGASFSNYALGDGTTNTDYKTTSYYCNPAVVHALVSNAFTVTGTLTNNGAGSISFAEVGMAFTAANYQFLLYHDAPLSGGPFTVSGSGGTLAITYTLTWT